MSKKKSEESNGVALEEPTGPKPEPAPEAAPDDARERPNMPVHVVKIGLVRCSVWLSQTEWGPRHHVTCSRIYKTEGGNWQSTTTFNYKDMLSLAKAIDHAHTWISQVIAEGDSPF
jgi:hypothetical protein